MLTGAIFAFIAVPGNLWAKQQNKEVGPVKVLTSIAPDDPTIGDEIVFEIQVDAEVNVEVLMPEFGEALDRYSIVDYVPKQLIGDDGSTTFTQRYTLQPDSSGEQSIPPILIEFVDNRPGKAASPDDMDAYEILTDRMDFTVKSVLPADASSELKAPLGELQLEPETSPVAWLGWCLLVLAIGTALFAAVPFYRKWQRQQSRRNAYEIARGQLDQLLSRPTPNSPEQVEQYYISISGIIRQYLENRFELRAPDLTTEEFLELAGSAGDLSHEHQGLLRDFLKQADLVKFAGVSASNEEVQRSTQAASRFLEDTRENAPVVDEATSQPNSTQEATHA